MDARSFSRYSAALLTYYEALVASDILHFFCFSQSFCFFCSVIEAYLGTCCPGELSDDNLFTSRANSVVVPFRGFSTTVRNLYISKLNLTGATNCPSREDTTLKSQPLYLLTINLSIKKIVGFHSIIIGWRPTRSCRK